MKFQPWFCFSNGVKRAGSTLSVVALTATSLIAAPALAETHHEVRQMPNNAEEQPLTCQQPLSHPIALVMDSSQSPDWSQGNYEPELQYGSLDAFPDAEIVVLLPEGHTLSDQDLAEIEGKGWGRRLFYFLLVPDIASEVIERYLEQNTEPLFGFGSNQSSERRFRSIARDVCLDFTFGFGAAWGLCDFFGDLIDQVIERVWQYYRGQ